MIFQNEKLYDLIPQRPPIVMVDLLSEPTDTEALTGLSVHTDNIFVEDGLLREPGIIEHIAQSAAAFAGYTSFCKGLPPRLGYIGEIKKCRIHCLPQVGEQMRTQLTILGEAAGITLLQAQTTLADSETAIAECQMKIFLKEEA